MGKPPSIQKLTKNAMWFSTKFNGYKSKNIHACKGMLMGHGHAIL